MIFLKYVALGLYKKISDGKQLATFDKHLGGFRQPLVAVDGEF
jgi:hypothetical protein